MLQIETEMPTNIYVWLGIAVGLWMLITFAIHQKNFFAGVPTRWHHSFRNRHFSSHDIYTAINMAISLREVPDIHVSQAFHFQGGLLSDKREYLRVARGDTMLLVCAAPFGTDYFISCWVGQPLSVLKDLATRLPFIGPVIAKHMDNRTYFQIDTETMFLEAVKYAVSQVVDELQASKGVRPLVELEREVNGSVKSAEEDAIEYV